MAHKAYEINPAPRLIAVTPSDSTVYDPPLTGVYVGTSGNIAVVGAGSGEDAVTITNVQDGTVLPIKVSKIMASNTTATNITGFYRGAKQ